ncbi:hypothetical protein [Campylobacter showae]|uniref:hypothetical protein n=2 Tax=Campylobacter showae TaxID=204 RepID=UPI000F077894|nr:hypothetical protein [Campylobacter showae]
MNTTNEQDSNLNGDFQNSNLANSDSDKFARDYDKEPIILKNYERFFVANLLPFCIFATVVIMLGLDYFWPEFDKTPRQILVNNIILGYFIVQGLLYIIISYYVCVIKNRFEVKFTSNFICFYKNDKIERKLASCDLNLSKSFWLMPSSRIIEIIFILMCILVLCIGLWYFIVIPIALNILFKLFFYIVFCGRLKGFSIFSAIVINSLPQSDQQLQYSGYLAGLVANKNYLLYIIDKKAYIEVKEYFEQKSNIEIDEIKKYYF